MSELQRLKAAGAESVAGDLFLNRVKVATLRHGQCIVTPEGEDVLKRLAAKAAVQDAPIKSETPAPAPAAPRTRRVAATPAPTPAPEPAASTSDLDDLLADK